MYLGHVVIVQFVVTQGHVNIQGQVFSDKHKHFSFVLGIEHTAPPYVIEEKFKKKSRIRETPTLSTDADSRTDTNLKRLSDLSLKKNKKKNKKK